MITIWNPLIQRLVISLDEPSLRLAVALIDDSDQIGIYVANCTGEEPLNYMKQLNLPQFPYPSGKFNWWHLFFQIRGYHLLYRNDDLQKLLSFKNKVGY